MAVETYTLDELVSIGDAGVRANLPDLDPTVPGSLIRSLVQSNALLVYAAQRNIPAAQKDFFPQTCGGEFLDFWAEINALTRIPGTIAEGNISLAGTLGVSIPLGTMFADVEGSNYISSSATTIANHAGSVSLSRVGTTVTAVTAVAHKLVDGLLITITGATDTDYNVADVAVNVLSDTTFEYTASTTPTAATDSGAYSSTFGNIPIESVGIGSDKNLLHGAVLTLQSTVTGVDSGAQANASGDGITAGADIEDDESLRERVLLANSIDPGVFTNAQIRLDALTIPTATRVFITNPSLTYTTDGTNVSGRVPDGLSESGGTATINMTANGTDNIYEGSTIEVAGVTPSDYNGEWTVATVTATALTFAISTSPANSSVHGTVSLDKLKNIPQPGTVYVFILDDNNDPPVPGAVTLDNAKAKIIEKLPAHTPADSVVVVSPFFDTVDVDISGLSPNTAAMKEAINNSLSAFFEDTASFAETVTTNQLIAAIQNTQDTETGQFVEEFSLDVPSADITIGRGSIGIKGTVTIA